MIVSNIFKRPQREQSYFLPHRPYLILGSLRQQLLYPQFSSAEFSNQQLQQVLHQVNLLELMNQFGWDRVMD